MRDPGVALIPGGFCGFVAGNERKGRGEEKEETDPAISGVGGQRPDKFTALSTDLFRPLSAECASGGAAEEMLRPGEFRSPGIPPNTSPSVAGFSPVKCGKSRRDRAICTDQAAMTRARSLTP